MIRVTENQMEQFIFVRNSHFKTKSKMKNMNFNDGTVDDDYYVYIQLILINDFI